jgi:excisionase family DNA binding protein
MTPLDSDKLLSQVVLTPKECQQILRVGKNRIYELIQTRQIKAYRDGGRWKILRESLLEYLHQQRSY